MIFDPSLEIQYEAGCHKVSVGGPVVESPMAHLKMLHYKKLNQQYYVDRHTLLNSRMSEINKQHGLGGHYNQTREALVKEYDNELAIVTKVIE